MKRTASLSSLFAALLIGCGPQVDLDDPDDSDGTGDGSTSGGSATTSVSTTFPPTATDPTLPTATDPTATATDPTATDTDPTATDTDPSDSSDTFLDSGECPDDIYNDVGEIPLSEIQEWVDADGNVLRNGCWGACEAVGIYGEILSCAVTNLDEPAGSDDGAPPPSTTGATTGGDPTGTDTGGEDPLMQVECEYMDYCLGGRGHAALRSDGRSNAADPIGRWAATCAHAEAASVPAFLGLARELAAHGAPLSLQSRALQAAREEIAHAKMMSRLARRRGAEVDPPEYGRLQIRDLEAIAIENAVEGCVRETWAALEASYQAQHAGSSVVRDIMSAIADDETRHAELARDIDAWCRSHLDDDACTRIDAARDLAVARLCAASPERSAEITAALGLPEGETAAALKAGLRHALWS